MDAMAHARSRPRKTVEDYLALPDDVRAELIDGELYVTPSPSSTHQDVAFRLARVLAAHADETGAGRAYIAPLDVHLDTGAVVQPDVLFIRAERLEMVKRWVYGAPDLVVEVVSRFHAERDRAVKRRAYAEGGVRAYWIVDPREASIEVLALEGHVYRPEGYFTGDQVLTTPTFPGLEVPLSAIFG